MIINKNDSVGRRQFLGSATFAIAAASFMPTDICWAVNPAFGSFPVLCANVGRGLLRIARDIYPHDRLPDDLYLQAIVGYHTAAAQDHTLHALFTDGVASLDARSLQQFSMAYSSIPAEKDRIALLNEIQSTVLVRRMRADLLYTLYNNKAVWRYFGYGGSSWEKGGYLHRGFDDIDWLDANANR